MHRSVLFAGVLGGCLTAPVPASIDWEATCGQVWPVDECASGTCAFTDMEARFAAATVDVWATSSGWPASTVEDHLRVRHVYGLEAEQSQGHTVWLQVTVDWVEFVFDQWAMTATGTPTDDQIHNAIDAGASFPFDPTAPLLLSVADVEEGMADCAAQEGGTFPTNPGWCEVHFPEDPDDDDDGDVRFDFRGEGPDPGWELYYSVDVGTGYEDCGVSDGNVPDLL